MYESEIRALKWVDIYSQRRHDKRAVSTWQGSCLRLLLHPPKGFARRSGEWSAEGRLTSGFKHNIEKQLGSRKSESMRNQRGSQLNWQTPLLCTPTHTRTPCEESNANPKLKSNSVSDFDTALHKYLRVSSGGMKWKRSWEWEGVEWNGRARK